MKPHVGIPAQNESLMLTEAHRLISTFNIVYAVLINTEFILRKKEV